MCMMLILDMMSIVYILLCGFFVTGFLKSSIPRPNFVADFEETGVGLDVREANSCLDDLAVAYPAVLGAEPDGKTMDGLPITVV